MDHASGGASGRESRRHRPILKRKPGDIQPRTWYCPTLEEVNRIPFIERIRARLGVPQKGTNVLYCAVRAV
jgi:hypothetical protein